MEWYVVIDGERRGPMSKASVQRLIELGVVKTHTPARRKDMKNWLQIGYIREFESASVSDVETRPRDLVQPPKTLLQRLLRPLRGRR